jgi:predicted dehydrogenase
MLRFGILGAARIAPAALIGPARGDPRVEVVAVAARDAARAAAFAQAHGVARSHASYEAVIEADDLDAVYIALPISEHRRWTIAALRAGKHVLCEKALACNADEAATIADAAARSGRVVMEAFHYRYHPLMLRALAVIRSGALGRLQSIEASFTVPIPDASDIRHQYPLGGGMMMDIGCYPIHWIRHLTGEEPEDLLATVYARGDIDITVTAAARLRSGCSARIHASMDPGCRFAAHLVARGNDGTLVIDNPLSPQDGHTFTLTTAGQTVHESFDRRPTYAYQLDAFVDAVVDGTPLPTDATDSIHTLRAIDAVYQAAGLRLRGA